MKIKLNESRLKEIINEEIELLESYGEGKMAKSQLYSIARYAIMLHDALEDEQELEGWVQSKITLATDYISKVKHYLEYEMQIAMKDPEMAVPESEPMMPKLDEEDSI